MICIIVFMDPLSFFLGFISAFIFLAGLTVIGALWWVIGYAQHKQDKDATTNKIKVPKSRNSIIVDTEKF